MTTTTTEILDTRTAHRRHDVIRTTILKMSTGHTVQVTITRNYGYDFQSSAMIEVWNDLRWNLVATIPYTQMAAAHVNPHRPEILAAALDRDEKELIRLANLVIA